MAEIRPIVRVVYDDCRKYLKRIANHQFHLCITDPPYRISNWQGFGDSLREKQSYETPPPRYSEWLPEVKRILRPDGSLYVFEHPNNLAELLDAIKHYGFQFRRSLIWYVPNRHASWFSPGQAINKHDILLYATRSRKDFTFNNTKTGEFKDVLRYASPMRAGVPGAKPLGLLKILLRTSSNRGDWVIDPFLGSGSTLRAAIETGRNGVGIELREELRSVIENTLKTNVESLDKFIYPEGIPSVRRKHGGRRKPKRDPQTRIA